MKRRGAILVVVMVLVAMASMVAVALMFRVRAEMGASDASARGHQAYAAASSGIQYAAAILKQHPTQPKLWHDSPELFRNQLVADDGINKWYFTVYAPNPPDYDQPRFGVSDEAAKININTADEATLKSLLKQQELVDCLLDYRDSDNEHREQGAEQDYYDRLKIPYVIKNGPFSTLEELLLVKGFTAATVYGEDANLNGLLDANEDDGDQTFPPDNRDGKVDTGLMELATAFSYESGTGPSGRANLNGPVEALRGLKLDAQTQQFIELYRAEGNSFRHPSELLNMRYTLKSDHVDPGGLRKGQEITSGVSAQQLATIMEKLTVALAGRRATIRGLVNVSSAPAPVLKALLDDESLAGRIIEAREALTPQMSGNTAWLLTQGILDADQFKRIAPMLTSRSYQFRVRCVGFGTPCGRFCILEAVVDLARGSPRIMYMREITRLGLPFAMDVDSQRVVGRS